MNSNDQTLQYSQVLEGIVEGHRKIIFDRYDYDSVTKNFRIPPFFNKAQSDELRDFFMDHIYPDMDKRAELEEAFVHLDGFIKSPTKLFAILRDSVSIMFKFGRHLPKILNAALKAMKSFRSATLIEDKMTTIALRNQMSPPYDEGQIKAILRQLPNQLLVNHQESIWPLYDILADRSLVSKILQVVSHLVNKMKEKPEVYSEAEIAGVMVGQDIISRAQELFSVYSDLEIKTLLHFVTKVEKEAYRQFMNEENDFV